MVHYILIAFTVATPIRGSALVEKLQNKSEFSYGQTVTVLLHGFLWSLAYTKLFQTTRNILIALEQKPLTFCTPLQLLQQGDSILTYNKNTKD